MERDPDRIPVLLADDHVVVRRGLRMLLEQEPDLTVVAEAGDADEALRESEATSPAVLVLDLNMPGTAPLSVVPRLRKAGIAVVVLTMEEDPAFAREALDAGASGYLLKRAVDDELVGAIRSAAAGETHVSREVQARLAARADAPAGAPGGLSQREADVLRLIALGYTNPEIGDELGISVRTVETHRARVQQKLGLSSRAELVSYAFENDFVPEHRSGEGP